MVLRSWPVRRAMAETDRPCRARSRIMTSSPRVTTGCSQNARGHPGAWPALPGPRGSPPGPGSGAELRNFQPALPGRIHPAATSWTAWADSLLASSARRSMAHDFRCPERRQTFLLPPNMRDWLLEDDIVHLILDAVALMDLSAFETAHKLGGAGQAPFAPSMLLSVLIYAYSHGVRSSRAIERLCGRNAGYRFIV